MKKSNFTERAKMTIKKKLRSMCGIEEIREEIDSIYYFLDKGIDITSFPKATGNLRDYQQANTELLRLFHEVCQKHQLTYWLDWGTLLGAVRHNGFIPWDDDLDVSMPREDFNKAKKIIVEAFSALGFDTVVKSAIFIWDRKSMIALDIFAVDQVEYDGDISVLQQKAKEFYTMCQKEYAPTGWRKMDGIDDKREKIMAGTQGKLLYYSAIEDTGGRLYAYLPEDIFPLQKHIFEQYEFMVPNHISDYVKVQYGDYMSYPRRGLLHHSRDGIANYDRAQLNHVSLSELREKLAEISLLE